MEMLSFVCAAVHVCMWLSLVKFFSFIFIYDCFMFGVVGELEKYKLQLDWKVLILSVEFQIELISC